MAQFRSRGIRVRRRASSSAFGDSVHYNGGLPGLSAIGSLIRETESGDAESEWDELREQSSGN
jgi:hypothetical protein